MGHLNAAPQIWKLAQDLGLRGANDPVSRVLGYCERRVKEFLREHSGCHTLPDFLAWVAAKLSTTFVIVMTNQELLAVRNKYFARGETRFATLEEDLADDVYGITFRLTHREPWEPLFVSVIDCRGSKAARIYFTKWHELAHLLVLTDQTRLTYRRTHSRSELVDAEEALMEVVAGTFAFYRPLVLPHIKEEISFDAIENLRSQLCPEASLMSSLIGFVTAWPTPCLLVRAEMANRKADRIRLDMASEIPPPALRAVQVSANEAARGVDFRIFENMRIPPRSVIHHVHTTQIPYGEAQENLSWWETSTGWRASDRRVLVKAKLWGDSVQALIVPLA